MRKLSLVLWAFVAVAKAWAEVPYQGPADAPTAVAIDHPPLSTPSLGNTDGRSVSFGLQRRKSLIGVHKVIGFITLAGLAATVAVGQLDLHDKYGGGGDTGKFSAAHQGLEYTTSGLFLLSALFGIIAPEPLHEPAGLRPKAFHEALMGIATVGLVSEIVLGIVSAHREGKLDQVDLAVAHQSLGYLTLATYALGTAVLYF